MLCKSWYQARQVRVDESGIQTHKKEPGHGIIGHICQDRIYGLPQYHSSEQVKNARSAQFVTTQRSSRKPVENLSNNAGLTLWVLNAIKIYVRYR